MEKSEFKIEEATIEEIQGAFTAGEVTARQLVEFYMDQIESLNPVLRGVVEVNPDARRLADESDREKEASKRTGVRLGDLHGIPVLLKDTIGTHDELSTTAGSYALVGSKVSRDAGVVARLRESGAVILGKASMSEWYKFRSLDGVPNGWCARAGQGVNPYVSSGTPCGSSSGSAISVAANMACVALGTETHSSIICPSDHNSVVGLKPTVGLTSRAGVIPMAPRWDTIGKKGAQVIDNLKIDNIDTILEPNHSGEILIMMADFKSSINAYLRELENSPVHSLSDIIAFNERNPDLEKLTDYDQQTFIAADMTDGTGEHEKVILDKLDSFSRNGFEKLMKENELDAMVTPGARACPVLAIGGCPGITVPAGYGSNGMPFGICFGGLKGSEPKLIEISYAFERATKARRPP